MGLDDFETEDALEEVADSGPDDLFEIPESGAADGATPAAPLPSPARSRTRDGSVLSSVSAERLELPSFPTESDYPAYDPELDEDLFQFDELFSRAETHAGDEYLSKVEMLAAKVAADAEHEERLEGRDEPGARQHGAATGRSAPDALRPAATLLAVPLFSTQAGRLLAASFLIVNAAFVFFAWSASRSFENAVQQARAEIAKGRTEAPPAATVSAQPSAGAVRTSLDTPPPPRVDEWVASLDSSNEITFRIARREIEEGEYAAARQRLNAMLASRDANDIDERTAADAEFLIAEAWTSEARDATEKGAAR